MKILKDGSIEGQTFSGTNYKGGYPAPLYGKETYREYWIRVKELKEKGFKLGDLSFNHWGYYCLGREDNEEYKQNEIIEN